MGNVYVNYSWIDENGKMQPAHDPNLCTPRQTYASLECNAEAATIDIDGNLIVLSFAVIETIYNEMNIKRS